MSNALKPLLSVLFVLCLLTVPLFNPRLLAQTNNEGISNLEGSGEQGIFLSSVYQSDRAVRHFEDSVMLADGWRSSTHLEAIQQLRYVDSLNTLKIDQYLDDHGYPDKENFSDDARVAPWQILLHSRNKEVRRKHFNDLYDAYKDGDLETRRFLLFLEDEYQRVYEKDFKSYNQGNQRIDELIKELENDGLQRRKFRMP